MENQWTKIPANLLFCVANFFDQESYLAASQVCKWWSSAKKSTSVGGNWLMNVVLRDSEHSTENLFRHRNNLVSISSEHDGVGGNISAFGSEYDVEEDLLEEMKSHGGFFTHFQNSNDSR